MAKQMDAKIKNIIAKSIHEDEMTIRGWCQAVFKYTTNSEGRLAQGAYQQAAHLLHDAQCELRKAAALHMAAQREEA